jgi:hypothetical protein
MDLTSLNNIISTANDVSDTLATGLQTVDPKLTTLMVDITGNKLTDEEFAAKVSALLKVRGFIVTLLANLPDVNP